jgi:hypothetical protein
MFSALLNGFNQNNVRLWTPVPSQLCQDSVQNLAKYEKHGKDIDGVCIDLHCGNIEKSRNIWRGCGSRGIEDAVRKCLTIGAAFAVQQ